MVDSAIGYAVQRFAVLGLLATGLGLAACAPAEPPPPPPPPPMAPPPPPPPPPPPMVAQPMMQVVRGSANALGWYPIGRRVPVNAQICLPANARFITFERLDGGGQITYGGGECNKRVTPPPKDPNETGGVWRGP